jgi:DNA-binding response OmpR family regulator
MNKSKILIVDDDPDLRRGLNLRLRANQYDTVYAEDAFSAVSMAEKERPQLILLDLGLPAQDGFTVLEKLQGNPSLGCIPVIVLSARDPYENQNRALQAGADAYFQKPADNGELLDAIRMILQNSISRSSDC